MGSSVDAAYIRKLHEDIETACEKLEKNGYESLVITLCETERLQLGSRKGRSFMEDRYALITDFIQYCQDEEYVVKTEKDTVRITESLDQETSDQTDQVVAIIKPDDDYQSGPVNSDTTRTGLFDGDSDGDSSLDNDIQNIPSCQGKADSNQKHQNRKLKNRNQCSICKQSFKLKSQLAKHISVHGTENAVVTNEAGVVITTDVTSEKVDRTADEYKSDCLGYTCNICGKQLTSMKFLENHQKIHNGSGHNCETCDKVFLTLWKLREHERIHSNEKPFGCEFCDRTFRTSSLLSNHRRKHIAPRIHSCDVCNKKFYRKDTLTVHKFIHSNESPYVCGICGRQFKNSGNLRKHRRIHTGERPYPCTICDKRFTKAADLTIHTRTHTGEKPYVCSVCGKQFRDYPCLLKHQRIHTGEKRYACDVCGARFTVSSTLVTHKRIHSDERPYACNVCDKKFRTTGDRNKHLITHLDQKPFKCEICSKSFSRAAILKKHQQNHFHSIDLYQKTAEIDPLLVKTEK